ENVSIQASIESPLVVLFVQYGKEGLSDALMTKHVVSRSSSFQTGDTFLVLLERHTVDHFVHRVVIVDSHALVVIPLEEARLFFFGSVITEMRVLDGLFVQRPGESNISSSSLEGLSFL
ncbi:hypothetical protein, partial [uncultured Paraglaciecola sp.]|uniref:hypothetical protein n=1 Tax=uncultured Paraglaciecola sp. TaxID=1765024 RepID=UPI0025ECA291